MAEIIAPAGKLSALEYELHLPVRDGQAGERLFRCDAHGTVVEEELDAYLLAVELGADVTAQRVTARRVKRVLPAVLRCDCGTAFDLASEINPCPRCRRLYGRGGGPILPFTR